MIGSFVRYLFRRHDNPVERTLFYITWFLRLSIFLAIPITLVLGMWELFFMNILALVLTFIPEFIELQYKISTPVEFDVVIVVFMYMSMFLGESFNAYEKFFWWDALLHTGSGLILSFAAFLLLYLLYRQKKFQASPLVIALLTFSVGMAFGAVWEVFEFAVDSIFGTNMQKSGLVDTMWDLIVNAIGALIISYAGYTIVKYNRQNGPVYRLVSRFYKENPQIGKATQ